MRIVRLGSGYLIKFDIPRPFIIQSQNYSNQFGEIDTEEFYTEEEFHTEYAILGQSGNIFPCDCRGKFYTDNDIFYGCFSDTIEKELKKSIKLLKCKRFSNPEVINNLKLNC